MLAYSHPRRIVAAAIAGLLVAVGLATGCAAPRAGPSAGEPAGSAPRAEGAAPAIPSAQPVRLRVAYSELTPAQGPNWVAHEAGIYAKHGLDTELLYIASAQTVAAVLADEVDVALGGGYAPISSRLAGSDLLVFLGLTSYYPYEFMVTPDISSPADLRGKSIGISRFGSSSDIATRVAMRHFGLDAERDVTLIQTGSLQERTAAMRTGAMAGALVSPPQTTVLKRLGFKSLLDLAATGDKTMNNVGFAKESWLRANEATAQAFVNAMIEAIHFAKTNRQFAERVLAQYLKLDDPDEIAEAYDFYVAQHLGRVPEPSPEAAREYLDSLAPTDPRAASARVEEFIDRRFLQRALASGVIERLYGQ